MMNYESFAAVAALIQSKSQDSERDKIILDLYNQYLAMDKETREAFIEQHNIKPVLRKLCRDIGITFI